MEDHGTGQCFPNCPTHLGLLVPRDPDSALPECPVSSQSPDSSSPQRLLFPSTVRRVPRLKPTETLELVSKGEMWSSLRLRARDTLGHSHDITLGPGYPTVLGLSLHRDHVDMLSHCPNPLLYAQHRPVVPENSEDPTPGPKRG